MTAESAVQLATRGLQHAVPDRNVLFLDLDNNMYPPSTGIDVQMLERIQAFLAWKLELDPRSALDLGRYYYRTYGLTVRGLVLNHSDRISAQEFDKHIDGSLDISMLREDPALRAIITAARDAGTEVLIFTNAGITHARRVLKVLGLADFFVPAACQGPTGCSRDPGTCAPAPAVPKSDPLYSRPPNSRCGRVIYCDYSAPNFPCKPEFDSYLAARCHASAVLLGGADGTALNMASVFDLPPVPAARSFFVDDSDLNIRMARALGWHALQLDPNSPHGAEVCPEILSAATAAVKAAVADTAAAAAAAATGVDGTMMNPDCADNARAMVEAAEATGLKAATEAAANPTATPAPDAPTPSGPYYPPIPYLALFVNRFAVLFGGPAGVQRTFDAIAAEEQAFASPTMIRSRPSGIEGLPPPPTSRPVTSAAAELDAAEAHADSGAAGAIITEAGKE
ncbi:hypothetical protein H696_04819 [Fonticula alba]|uniref:Pyrimidine 5'-nucleotidase n=1 Tax=Fonticula alba TaxID=691883 RepID=A0A058Z346_FONAL|nr:hypothetical protein H696_04819 [Fonticula alba]KCV68526.1 hypothetical protein H696_04819 [Fonticula alba]|eukprot:XP_009496958.1 hypothetical protein H696_04819 [Fonticula alba]